ncbi:serine protein kinase RIO [Paeniglutamicibacter cryotolerans]|uniref:non-specific serine/threonine protein kinase n=1 Tax=Paeniglutamicibacter cryotolerans TaxID=670079 RepID=A0A839QHE5_9MICC|nr:RIO1 family regulatory kinase/ATPase [Paeniglutamicibacter cryotolerans]MBB2994164.1 RIO kinase 1 [Paeniglutamicibacter cryotolerans]
MKKHPPTRHGENPGTESIRRRQPRPDRGADWNMLDVGLAVNQRFSTWPDAGKLMRGPRPYPEFVIEDAAAIDTDLGVLKTGKEADVILLERAVPGNRALLASKRYRSETLRLFHRSAAYTEGRSVRRSRDARALEKGSGFGRSVEAAGWAASEWTCLRQCFEAGVPVPYPVQLDGTEVLMEFIGDPEHPGIAAPRLQQLHPAPDRLEGYWRQLLRAMEAMARLGYAHGDLSPYNVLGAGDRLVIIDLPQMVDLAGNSGAMELLKRDCANMCHWFTAHGHDADPEELFSTMAAAAR